MLKTIEATGKTIYLAIQAGLEEHQMDRDSVSVEVLEQPRSGFFGIGGSPAKVSLTYEVPDPAPVKAPEAPQPEKKPEAPKPQPEKKAERKPEAPKPQEKKPEKKPVDLPAPAPEGTVEARIETFVKGLLEHMGSDAVPSAVKTADDTYAVELIGEHLGMLIGRRGDTLDALQYLTSLATKVAGKVVKTRRNITLEPMNAYERHVIHAALQDYPDVTTYSTGTEPGRRVVVAYSRYRSTEE